MANNDHIYEWLVRVIDTCYHDFHFEAIDNLISLYYEREKNAEKKDELEMLKAKKWNEIHMILK